MYTLDPRLRGLPASREQVAGLYRSLNQPHLAIPGKKAGPAGAFVLGLKGPGGLNVLVYLFLSEAADCAVYTSDRRNVSAGAYAALEGDAVAFVESMGFMMDNLNFGNLPVGEQDELMKSLPVFARDPKGWTGAQPAGPVVGAGELKGRQAARGGQLAAWGRILSSF